MKNKSPKEFADWLVKEYWSILEEELPAKRHIEEVVKCAKLCVRQMYDFGSLNGLREPLIYLNMTETELNKILKEL